MYASQAAADVRRNAGTAGVELGENLTARSCVIPKNWQYL